MANPQTLHRALLLALTIPGCASGDDVDAGETRASAEADAGDQHPPDATTDATDTGAAETGATTGGSGSASASTTDVTGPTTDDASTSAATSADGTTSATTSAGSSAGDDTTTGDVVDPWTPKGCPSLYSQEILPTFELDLSSEVLKALDAEWKAADEDKIILHPVKSFRYGDVEATDAMVRLRGNDKWWFEQGKMQLQVSFNKVDPKGRFLGQKHLLFDCARYNESFLRDRLSLAILRDVGVQAPCANNARLVINGEYYGLFTSIEKIDSEFLERSYEYPDGNLYKRNDGWVKKTNEEDLDESDLEALLAVKTIGELEALMDVDQALLEYATEAVIPDADGAWAGGLNFYVYHDPIAGFHVLPWDLDATFTRLDPDTDPVDYLKPGDHGRPFYDLALKDEKWRQVYLDDLAYVLEVGYDVALLQGRMDAWAAQIEDAVASDPNRPFSMQDHLDAVQEQREFIAERAAFLAEWLECVAQGMKC